MSKHKTVIDDAAEVASCVITDASCESPQQAVKISQLSCECVCVCVGILCVRLGRLDRKSPTLELFMSEPFMNRLHKRCGAAEQFFESLFSE